MLNVITLSTIDNIFTLVATNKLTTNAKMLYINCLTYHFKNKKPTIINAVAFDIFKTDIPNYDRYQKSFEELHKAELVIIRENAISFTNSWGKFIDRSQLEKVMADTYVAGFQFQGVNAFIEEMRKSASLYELCQMKHKISLRQVELLLELFYKEQLSISKTYNGYSDCAKHFINWIPNNVSKVPQENVKSKSKLLGE
jgi:hypothetical protein